MRSGPGATALVMPVLWWLAGMAPAQADTAGARDFLLDIGAARTEGDYGLDESTTIDVLSVGARWYLPRGELHLHVPFLRIDGPGDVRFVGGQPVSGFSGSGGDRRAPVRPPVQPPGGFQPPGPDADNGGAPEEPEVVLVPRRESGLGDIVLSGELYLLQGTASRPWVTGLLRLKAPTGDRDRGLGTGATDVEAGLGLMQPLGPAHLLFDAGYTLVGDGDDLDLRNTLRLGGGVSVPFGPEQRTSAYLYLENRSNAVRGFDDQRTVTVGLGSWLGEARRVRLSGALYAGLSDSAEDFGLALRLGYRL